MVSSGPVNNPTQDVSHAAQVSLNGPQFELGRYRPKVIDVQFGCEIEMRPPEAVSKALQPSEDQIQLLLNKGYKFYSFDINDGRKFIPGTYNGTLFKTPSDLLSVKLDNTQTLSIYDPHTNETHRFNDTRDASTNWDLFCSAVQCSLSIFSRTRCGPYCQMAGRQKIRLPVRRMRMLWSQKDT
jgi:hypothetical protein